MIKLESLNVKTSSNKYSKYIKCLDCRIYMEFYNKEIENYLTIGIGLRAIKNKNVEFYQRKRVNKNKAVKIYKNQEK